MIDSITWGLNSVAKYIIPLLLVGIPLYALGYHAASRIVEVFSQRAARAVFLLGGLGALIGAVIHACTALQIHWDLEAGAAAACDYDGQRPLRLLVLGGSLGAQPINRVLPGALRGLADTAGEGAIEVRHQAGEAHAGDVTTDYGEWLQRGVQVLPFIEDMAAAYAWADLVLCRAGALTIAEVAVMGAVAAVRILHRRRLADVDEEIRPQVELELAAEHERIAGGAGPAILCQPARGTARDGGRDLCFRQQGLDQRRLAAADLAENGDMDLAGLAPPLQFGQLLAHPGGVRTELLGAHDGVIDFGVFDAELLRQRDQEEAAVAGGVERAVAEADPAAGQAERSQQRSVGTSDGIDTIANDEAHRRVRLAV